MRIGSLFSGAGALDLAALALFPGSSMAWHCEIEPSPAKVLAHHWPDVPNLSDVTRVRWDEIEPVDVLTGGFPCQDVSTAGRRAGLAEGTRSGLWSHMRDAIAVMRPRWVLIENVKGLLSAPAIRGVESADDDLGDGTDGPALRALGAVLGDLADIGYDAGWTCIRASDVGACHQRARVFILAYPAHPEGGRRPGVGDGTVGAAARGGRERDASGSGRVPAAPVALLPTPSVADGDGGHVSRSGARVGELLLPGLARAYTEGALLPTPRATDGTKGGPNQRGSSGELMLPSAVAQLLPTPKTTDSHYSSPADLNRNDPNLRAIAGLLPTPSASDSTGGGAHPDRREGHSRQLIDYALMHGSPRWGIYEAAIRRQESHSRPAPSPTEPNTKGRPRLAARFAEWMMFWPEGWVTEPEIGLSRVDQLRAIGNGVVPPQAYAAFRHLRTLCEVAE